MAISSVQKNVLELWHAIQTSNEDGIKKCLDSSFSFTTTGVMNGQSTKVKGGEAVFTKMCMVTGNAVNHIGSLSSTYGLGIWKNKEVVFLVAYDQDLVFTPTPIPATTTVSSSAENSEIADQQILSTPEEQRMASKGLQVFKWNLDGEGKVKFTRMIGFEIDKTAALDLNSYSSLTDEKLILLGMGQSAATMLEYVAQKSSKDVPVQDFAEFVPAQKTSNCVIS